ncbi:MAG: hypothetical protein M1816_004950 [Peltula sp. TS41687]|nr:MAG: hypothetical protein M1816_004950 [Peltula sp. TS41687]
MDIDCDNQPAHNYHPTKPLIVDSATFDPNVRPTKPDEFEPDVEPTKANEAAFYRQFEAVAHAKMDLGLGILSQGRVPETTHLKAQEIRSGRGSSDDHGIQQGGATGNPGLIVGGYGSFDNPQTPQRRAIDHAGFVAGGHGSSDNPRTPQRRAIDSPLLFEGGHGSSDNDRTPKRTTFGFGSAISVLEDGSPDNRRTEHPRYAFLATQRHARELHSAARIRADHGMKTEDSVLLKPTFPAHPQKSELEHCMQSMAQVPVLGVLFVRQSFVQEMVLHQNPELDHCMQ